MAQRGPGVAQQHARARIAHHLSHEAAHVGAVTVDGAAAARAFAIARRTMVEALVGIVYQRTAAGAELLVAFIMQTVEPYHELYCLFLLGYLVQWLSLIHI